MHHLKFDQIGRKNEETQLLTDLSLYSFLEKGYIELIFFLYTCSHATAMSSSYIPLMRNAPGFGHLHALPRFALTPVLKKNVAQRRMRGENRKSRF